jgi:hypothetical protein
MKFNLISYLAPLIPRFIAEQCLYHENSSGILTWSINDIGTIQGFILELDHGIINSKFQVKHSIYFKYLLILFRKYMMVMKQCVLLMVLFHHVSIQLVLKRIIKQVKVLIVNV